jgi:hypothetical protein
MPTASSHVRYLAGGCVCVCVSVAQCISCSVACTPDLLASLSLSHTHTHTHTLAYNTGALRYVAGDGDAASEVLAQDAQLFGRLEELLTRCGASDDATVARHCAVSVCVCLEGLSSCLYTAPTRHPLSLTHTLSALVDATVARKCAVGGRDGRSVCLCVCYNYQVAF